MKIDEINEDVSQEELTTRKYHWDYLVTGKRQLRYHRRNREHQLEGMRRYYQENKEQRILAKKRYIKTHKPRKMTPEMVQVKRLKKNLKNANKTKVTRYKLIQILKMESARRAAMYEYQNNASATDKPTLMCIVGDSGVGKTLASLHLKYKLDANVICSFTTRPPRGNEKNGRDHYFIDVVPPKDQILAFTKYGGYSYYSLRSQVYGPCTVYVIDEKGLLKLIEKFSDDYNIVTVYITRLRRLRNECEIDKSRMSRDKGRKRLDLGFYNYIVENNSTKAELFKNIEAIYNKLKGEQ